jgi:hypothetical protein
MLHVDHRPRCDTVVSESSRSRLRADNLWAQPLPRAVGPRFRPGGLRETKRRVVVVRQSPGRKLSAMCPLVGTESTMRTIRMNNAGDGRLRFVFEDAVLSFNLAASPTFEDIARSLRALAPRHGELVAIDLTLAVSLATLASQDTGPRNLQTAPQSRPTADRRCRDVLVALERPA